MSTQLFYRGTVGGRQVALAFQAITEASAEALVARLAFAGFTRTSATPTQKNSPAPAEPLIFTVAERTAADPVAPAAASNIFHRALTPEIELALHLPTAFTATPNAATSPAAALRPATFTIARHADPAQWLTRVHSELLHQFGLFTPALALHASSVLTPAPNTPPLHTSPARTLTPAPTPTAWIFCGPSGTGKTTISTVLLQSLPLVDEEIILVDLPPRGTSARAKILNGPNGSSVPIAGLFALKQSPHCAVNVISSGAFIAKNMTKPFGLDLPALLEQRLEKLAQLVAAEPPRELAFNLNTAELLQTLTR